MANTGAFGLNIIIGPGIYTINFGDVAGYVTPSLLTVEVRSDYTTVVTIEYTK